VLAEDAIRAAVTDYQRKRGGATASEPAKEDRPPPAAGGILKSGL
jgi:hypothetical protein